MTAGETDRPLLYLDVDGVINDLEAVMALGILDTRCEIVWCTTWRTWANDEIADHVRRRRDLPLDVLRPTRRCVRPQSGCDLQPASGALVPAA